MTWYFPYHTWWQGVKSLDSSRFTSLLWSSSDRGHLNNVLKGWILIFWKGVNLQTLDSSYQFEWLLTVPYDKRLIVVYRLCFERKSFITRVIIPSSMDCKVCFGRVSKVLVGVWVDSEEVTNDTKLLSSKMEVFWKYQRDGREYWSQSNKGVKPDVMEMKVNLEVLMIWKEVQSWK